MSEQSHGPRPCLSYSIDRENRLAAVDGGWLDFATANDAPWLSPAAVLGRPIEAFISGLSTRYLYRLLYERVRRGETFRLPFRCDAPEVRRSMVLQLSPAGSDGVQCDTFLLEFEDHPPIPLLDAESPRGGGLVTMCSCCKHIRLQGEWLDIDEAVRKLQLFVHPLMPEISHGVCPTCMNSWSPAVRRPILEIRQPATD